jgi:hypothetical protein
MQRKMCLFYGGFIPLLVVSVLVSCTGSRVKKKNKLFPRGDEQSSTENETSIEREQTSAGESDRTGNAEESQLSGLWKAPCIDSPQKPNDASKKTQRSQAQFSGSQVTFVTDLYLKENCQAFTHSVIVTSTYTIGSVENGLTSIDFTLKKIDLIPRTTEEAENMNDLEVYGITHWAKNTPIEITGQKQYPDEAPLPSSGQKLYDVFQADSESKELAFGLSSGHAGQTGSEDENGTTPEKRPQIVSRHVVYQKKEP